MAVHAVLYNVIFLLTAPVKKLFAVSNLFSAIKGSESAYYYVKNKKGFDKQDF